MWVKFDKKKMSSRGGKVRKDLYKYANQFKELREKVGWSKCKILFHKENTSQF